MGGTRKAVASRGTIFRLLLVSALVLVGTAAFGAIRAHAALSPFKSYTGKIALSVDAAGTNNAAGTTIRVQKSAGATVRAAYLFTARTPFGGSPVDGDVQLK